MYLKQVELENFKSFGGKTVVPFMEGYMAVTGPNGSGKSNIADAILFVLGPRSAKAVRAGRLSDLVFDGAGKGKAKYTKVSLVFDNTDRLMPWDADTVRLTRYIKLAENGTDYTSYFFINDQKSSLSEFDTLLTKARISADGYNLVQQGDVVHIVNMGALERRRILDGISGIASFDADLGRAQNERAETAANLDRIGIIRTEQEKQVKALERDRVQAQQYLEAKEALDTAKNQLVVRQQLNEQAKLGAIGEFIVKIDQKLAKLKADKEAALKDREANKQALEAKEAEIEASVGPEYKKTKSDVEDARVALATAKDRRDRAAEDREAQEGFRDQFTESIADNRKEYRAAEENLAGLRIKQEAAQREAEAAAAAEKKINDETAAHGGELTKLQTRLSELARLIDQAANADQSARAAEAAAAAAAGEKHRAQSTAEEALGNAQFAVKDADWNLQSIKRAAGPQNATDELGKQVVALKQKEGGLEKQEAQLKDAVNSREAEFSRLSAEKRVSENYNRGSQAVAAIMALRDRGEMRGISGTVAELATAEPGFETALSVAAGGKMQAVVVDNDQTAADCIAYLKKNGLGRVTFLPLSKMMPGKPRAKAIMVVKRTVGYATDLMTYDPRYQNVFWYVFGDTLVVETLQQARELMGGVRLVTRAGELVEASGAMVGGTVNQRSLPKFGASSQTELDRAGEELRKANDALSALQTELRQLRDDIRAADDRMREALTKGAGAKGDIAGAEAKLVLVKQELTKKQEESRTAAAEAAGAEQALVKAQADQTATAAALQALRDERDTKRARLQEIAPADLQERIQQARTASADAARILNDLQGQIGAVQADMAGADAQKKALDGQLAEVAKKLAAAAAGIAKYDGEIKECTVRLEAFKNIVSQMEQGIEGLRSARDVLSDRGYQLDAAVSQAQKDLETQEGVRQSQEAQAEISQARLAQLAEDRRAITVPVPEPIPSEDELRRTIRTADGRVTAFGNVNLRAIEDYDSRKAELDKLVQQCDQLQVRIRELDQLAKELTARKKGLFMQSYNAVAANFKAIYSKLSGGGESYMALDDPDDPFQGGLQINAKPRNGKMLRLEALSGGEKSLTALSFIFAIQEYQPSPFYVLDEVDMFLDAVNAELVAKRIKESSATAQFIQVSLRKVTLTLADHLIGVTRPPSGVSKVIIQPDLAEVSKYEEEARRRQQVPSVSF
ncbi:MAG: chromosome segregation protein SMC [Methanomethylophilus sp.]